MSIKTPTKTTGWVDKATQAKTPNPKKQVIKESGKASLPISSKNPYEIKTGKKAK